MSQTSPEVAAPDDGGKVLKRLLIGVLIVFLAVIVLAEFGVIRIESTKTDSAADGKYQFKAVNWRGMHLGSFRLVPNVTVREAGAGRAVAEDAAKALRNVPPGQKGADGAKFEITIDQVAVAGSPALPLHRNGSCTFTATYKIDAVAGGASYQAQGQVKGNVQQSMKGLSSLGLYRQAMGKAVADAIINDIKKTIAKSGS